MKILTKNPTAIVKSVSVIEYASMCLDVYRTETDPVYHTLTECGWERSEKYSEGNFFARLYKRKHDKKTVLAYRGTEFFSFENWEQNARIYFNRNPRYPQLAEEKFYAAKEFAIKDGFSPPHAVTGHSLGGCLAQYAALQAKKTDDPVHAITFNPLHVPHWLIEGNVDYQGKKISLASLPRDFILNYSIKTDTVHEVLAAQGLSHKIDGSAVCTEAQAQASSPEFYAHPSFYPAATSQLVTYQHGVRLYCLYQEHRIQTVISKLWLGFYDDHGDNCLPIKPRDAAHHAESTHDKSPDIYGVVEKKLHLQ